MDIHEYQAKEILANFGVEVPPGALAYSPEQAAYRARELGGDMWVVKAQVHAGGRGKAGGVKLCTTDHEIQDACENMFGRKLVTHQTGPAGKGIYRVCGARGYREPSAENEGANNGTSRHKPCRSPIQRQGDRESACRM